MSDLDYVARVVARQKPAWPPGTRHGYHTLTIGLCMQELIRRVDPAHRTLGRFFHEEIAGPLDLEFYIGLPKEIPGDRIASLKMLSRTRGLLALRYTPFAVTMKMIAPGRCCAAPSWAPTSTGMTDAHTRWNCPLETA